MEKIAENIYIIPGPTNVGVITDFQNQIYLIDSGTSNGDAERIKEELDKTFSNYTLKAIINTHSHADHAGGNAFFKEKTGCKIFIQKKRKTAPRKLISSSVFNLGCKSTSRTLHRLFKNHRM